MTEKDKLSRRKLNIYFALGVVVLAALAAVGVIHFKNVVTEPSGNDVWGHMYKSEYLYKALKRGQIYPLYDETWYNGIQLYRYWPPLSYYITALLMCFTGGNVINAYYLLFGVYIFFGGLAFLLIGRRIGRPVFGTALAVLWFFMPENARMYIDEAICREWSCPSFSHISYILSGCISGKRRDGHLPGFSYLQCS